MVEIRTTAALQHPHLLSRYNSGEADGFNTDVTDALHYAHEHGVIHRDIKPQNIPLANGRTMVGDFGIALVVGAAPAPVV